MKTKSPIDIAVKRTTTPGGAEMITFSSSTVNKSDFMDVVPYMICAAMGAQESFSKLCAGFKEAVEAFNGFKGGLIYDEVDAYPSLEWQLKHTKSKERRKIRRKMRKRNKLNKSLNNRRIILDNWIGGK